MRREVIDYATSIASDYSRVTDDDESLASRLLTYDHSFGMWGFGVGWDVVLMSLYGYSQMPHRQREMFSISRMSQIAHAASLSSDGGAVCVFGVEIKFPFGDICLMRRFPMQQGPLAVGGFDMYCERAWHWHLMDDYHEHLVQLAIKEVCCE